MHKPVNILDQHAEAISRSLDIMVYSLEGLYEKMARENPTAQGVHQFWIMAHDLGDQSITATLQKLQSGIDALKASLSDSERDFLAAHDDSENFIGVAHESFGAIFAQARVAYAKRLRDLVAARAFGTDTYTANPKYMARNGHRWDFTEVTYLNSRQLMVDWYNGVKIGFLAEQGVEEFTLLTDDPELIYSTYRVDEYPQVAAELFHPRTTKLVGGAHVPS